MTVLRRADGFTLVELLTVIGIIALLIAILLPSLFNARRQAMLIKCLARQRELGIGAANYANEHRGFYPLAGILQTKNSPEGVGDPAKVRYGWHHSPKGYMQMALWHEAVATGLGVKPVDYGMPPLARQYSVCPSVAGDPEEAAAFYSATDAAGFASEYSSYVINEGVFGWNDSMKRLRGNASRVHQPSQTVMVMDGLRTLQRGVIADDWGWVTVTNLTATLPVTLGDALADNGKAGSSGNFDPKRHRGKMNVLLMDGHAETRSVDEKNLQDLFILAN